MFVNRTHGPMPWCVGLSSGGLAVGALMAIALLNALSHAAAPVLGHALTAYLGFLAPITLAVLDVMTAVTHHHGTSGMLMCYYLHVSCCITPFGGG